MHKILVAVKRSSSSAEAVALAIELASTRHAELIFVHVVPTLDIGHYDDDEIAIAHEPTTDERAVLNEVAMTARDHGIVAATYLLRGSTAEQLVEAADSHGVDLIVVGARAHSAIANALLGNVSLRVLRKSSRPVLLRKQSRRRSGSDTPSISVSAS